MVAKALVAALAVALALSASAAGQPNVVLIVTDDQRADTLAYMPTVGAELVAKGVRFRNAFATNPVCCPSRTSILTGRWSHSTGVWSNGPGPFGGFPAFADQETLPVWLERVGYRTMLAGKYLNGYAADYTLPTYVPSGWDRWFAFWGRGNPYFAYQVTDGETLTTYGSDPADYSTDVLAQAAVEFISDPEERPFFLYFAPTAPHWSVDRTTATPAPRHVGAFTNVPPYRSRAVNEANVSDKPRYVRRLSFKDVNVLASFRAQQLESLLAVDEAVGAMLAALEETGELADTLIVFTSDNGYAWGEHRWFQKTAPYEEAIRVPLVVRWDAALAPRTVRRNVLNVDLAPTIAEAARAQAVGAKGRSLLSLARRQATTWRKRFLIEQWGGSVPAYCGIRGSRWKYVQYANGQEELYDLRRDPLELRSRHRWKPRVLERMGARVAASSCRPPGWRSAKNPPG